VKVVSFSPLSTVTAPLPSAYECRMTWLFRETCTFLYLILVYSRMLGCPAFFFFLFRLLTSSTLLCLFVAAPLKRLVAVAAVC